MKNLDLALAVARLALLILTLWSVVGCDKDETLAKFAQQAAGEQARQNERMAAQTEAVVAESHELAEAARQLVEQDAQARRELIAAEERMAERMTVERTQLDHERREIARQRHRDPIVAEAVRASGVLLACVTPLVIALLVLRSMSSQEPDHAAVAELLVQEVTSEQPVLLPAPVLRRLPVVEERPTPVLEFDPPDCLPPF